MGGSREKGLGWSIPATILENFTPFPKCVEHRAWEVEVNEWLGGNGTVYLLQTIK